jgi:hypothetical protein
VEKCLEKLPENRFQTAGELSAVLQAVVFASDASVDDPAPANYAMPFCAGLSIECAVFALLDVRPLWIALTATELWYMAGAFGAMAVLLSPVARAATGPLDDEMRDWFRNRFRRKLTP